MCNSSLDCLNLPESEGVVKQCYGTASFSDETNFCDCPNWYGWKGQFCDEYTGQLLFYSISQMVFIVMSMFIVMTILRTLYIYIFYAAEGERKTDPIVLTAIFIFGGAFFILIHSCLILSALVDHTRFEVIAFDEFFGEAEDVNVKHGKAATFSLFLATSFFFLAALQVFHTWHKVIVQASFFVGNKQFLLAKRFHIAIKVFIVLYAIAAVIIIAADERAISLLVTVGFALFLGIAYPLVYCQMSKAFKEFQVYEHDFISKTISLIRFCCFVNSVCLVLSAIAMLILFLLYPSINERIGPGDFNYILFLREVTGYVGLFMLTVKSWYVNSMLARSPMPRGVLLSVLWEKWDSKHEDIYCTQRTTVTVSQIETVT